MGELGGFFLFISWLLAIWSTCAGIYAGKTSSKAYLTSARYATVAHAIFLGGATTALATLFVNSDFTNQFVWQFSDTTMPSIYKITAVWGGMDGSMLLWAFLLSVMGAVVVFTDRNIAPQLLSWVIVGFHTTTLFFTSIVLFLTNPFRYIKAPFIPLEGNGLNPLLQNPYMAAHPPTLYLGFTTFAVPFAFCIGALLAGRITSEWIKLTRRWTLIAWGFLTIGITLGGHWAYLELGWGGFWAWDPVENASFLPWLTGTAFLHSIMVQERKGMLKAWNVWLIVITYGLTVFGTFLTRSGIVQSVHAFASTDIGWTFLAYLSFLLVGVGILHYLRRKELSSDVHLESVLSRESAFLLNNLLFLSICFAVLWGVMFPVLSEAVTGKKQTIGIPYFNAVTIPLFLAMLILMGVGPLISWRKASPQRVLRTFVTPFIGALFIGIICVWAGAPSFYTTLSYSICYFITHTILREFYRGYKAQRLSSTSKGLASKDLTHMVRRHHTRYGGYLVHLGVVIMVLGITASMAHKLEVEFSLLPGQSEQIGRFKFQLKNLTTEENQNYGALMAQVELKDTPSDKILDILRPELRRYIRKEESTSEVAIRSTLREDVYLVLAGLDDSGTRAAFKLFINPLQKWLWIGLIVVVAGTLVTLTPPLQSKSSA